MPIKQDFEITVKEAERRVDSYFNVCDEKGAKYSVSGLCRALDIPRSRFKVLSKLGDEYLAVNPGIRCDFEREHRDEFAQWRHLVLLKKAVQRVQEQLESRTDTNAIFQLKQAEIANYTDRPVVSDASVSVSIKLVGVGNTDPFG